jgi:hypothetical protein
MKTSHLGWLLSVLVVGNATAQTQLSGNAAPSGRDGYHIKSRDANISVWERIGYEDAPDGTKIPRVHRYTEIASGLNVLNSQGQYEDADESFEITSDGFALARRTQHRLTVSPSLGDPEGNVNLRTPEGRVLRSSVVALNLFNRASGESLMVSEVSPDAEGQLVAPNEIVFRNAFSEFNADVRILNLRGEFHQDVLLNEAFDLKDLEAAGFPPDVTVLEIWTEYLESPEPRIASRVVQREASAVRRAVMVEPDISTDDLDWGIMKQPSGIAYLKNDKAVTGSGEKKQRVEINVSKRWMTINNRRFIVESMPLGETEAMFAQMPVKRMSLETLEARTRNIRSEPPSPRMARMEGQTIHDQMAGLAPGIEASTSDSAQASLNRQSSALNPRIQLVMDPVTINGSLTNVTFKGDSTYFISSVANLYGSNVIEGGSVLKFTNGTSAQLNLYGPLKCETGPFRPGVLTAKDDNSIGEPISGSSGDPEAGGNYGGTAIVYQYSAAPLNAHDLRISYKNTGISFNSGIHEVRNCQFYKVNTALTGGSATVKVQNVLMHRIAYVAFSGGYITFRGEHLTMHEVGNLGSFYNGALNLTNCLFVNVTNWGSGASFAGAYNATNTGSGVFETVLGGLHYLANGSVHRNAGTTNIDSTLLAELKSKTTYPPISYTNVTFTTPQTFSPQAQRDTDVPDKGYHYDPLDYLFGGCHANSNLTFTAGTAVGWFRTTSGWYHAGHGIHLGDYQTASFNGTVTAPTSWVRCNTVQEQDGTAGYGPGGISGWAATPATAPYVRGTFMRSSMMAGDGNHFRDDNGYIMIHMRHSEFYAGGLGGYVSQHHFTNCLMDRTFVGIAGGGSYAEGERIYRNCTFRGGLFQLYRWNPGYVMVSLRDCAFDGMAFDTANDFIRTNPTYNDYNYNAYTNSANPLPIGGANDVQGVTFNWQTGPLGKFYLPSNSELIDEGSQAADLAGLYHFTTQIGQMKEATSTVDIGYHYVAAGPDTAGLVGYWPMDEGSGMVATDVSVSGKNGTLANGTLWTGGQVEPGALKFDGVNDRVDLPGSTATYSFIQNSLVFSIATWIKLDGDRSTRQAILINAGTYTQRGFNFLWETYGSGYGNHSLRIATFIGTAIGIDAHCDDNATINDNNWHHVAVVGNGTAVTFYVDGQPKTTTYKTTFQGYATGNATADASMGSSATWGLPLNGSLDDLHVYSRALSSTEIASLANGAVFAGDTDGDGIPDYLEDANGNGNGADDPTSWQSYNSLNGLTSGNGLRVFTPLK